MLYTYRNIETGVEIQSTSPCKGKDWVYIAPSPSVEMREAIAKLEASGAKTKKVIKRTKKDGNSK